VEDRGNLRGRRVLVVDDEPYILKILVFKLRTAGVVPVEATDGEAALRAAQADPPDAILLDISLSPGLSGFDVLRRLKEDPRTRPVPVVVLTGRTLPEERAAGLRLGAARFLTKPFSMKALLHDLESVLAAAGEAASAGPPPDGGGPPETSV
jgi:DNA-binding response OmpR family regulator